MVHSLQGSLTEAVRTYSKARPVASSPKLNSHFVRQTGTYWPPVKAAIQYCMLSRVRICPRADSLHPNDIRKQTALPSKNLPCEEGSLGTTPVSCGCRRDVHRGRSPAKQIGAVGRVRTGSSGDSKPQKIRQSQWECSRGLSHDPRDSEAHPHVRLDCGPHVASSSISGAPAALVWHHVTLIHLVVLFDCRSAHDIFLPVPVIRDDPVHFSPEELL